MKPALIFGPMLVGLLGIGCGAPSVELQSSPAPRHQKKLAKSLEYVQLEEPIAVRYTGNWCGWCESWQITGDGRSKLVFGFYSDWGTGEVHLYTGTSCCDPSERCLLDEEDPVADALYFLMAHWVRSNFDDAIIQEYRSLTSLNDGPASDEQSAKAICIMANSARFQSLAQYLEDT